MAIGDVEQRIAGEHELVLGRADRLGKRVEAAVRERRTRTQERHCSEGDARRAAFAASAALALVALLGACAFQRAAPSVPAAPPPQTAAPGAPPTRADCIRIVAIEVRKRARRIEVACEGGARFEWTVAIGRVPLGPKRSAGDHRTPEGDYRVIGRARASRFHRFLAFDYPSRADAELARAEARLPESDYRRIAAAHAAGAPPPDDTALGGHLGFHGEGARWRGDSIDLDWTDGCIAMSDSDIEFLAERSAPGTRVRILP
jgi:hypothetical protein